ncbi:unnamed protein product [Amaranthus hypochondriacus]
MSSGIYVTAAFKSIHPNKAYIFMKNEYVFDDYGPATSDDKILYGPDYIGDVFSSLKCTVFASQGIDCAFASHDAGHAYIFSGDICAKWRYALDSPNDRIVLGPKPIADMFHFLRGTVFECGVDAAFESYIPFEAYLFKGDQYACINYSTHNGHLITIAPIRQNWPCLRGTMFENGFDAAFHLHVPNDAYLFKGDSYGRISYTPGAPYDELRWSGKIKDSWTGIARILPRKNCN